MRPALKRLFLLALATDAEALLNSTGWQTRCLHCRTRLDFKPDGERIGVGSLEHVVPQAWFGKRAAQALCDTVGNDANDARNLALACVRCNHSKGHGPDRRGPGDAAARDIVARLLQTRLARYRAADAMSPTGHADAQR